MPREALLLPLSAIAHGRSGDKGNHANVAVIAYTPAGYDWLCAHLTADVVQHYFAPLKPSKTVRYEAANLRALNFMLHDVLAGGASRSLRSDSQGKTYALALLQMPFAAPENVIDMLRPCPACGRSMPLLAGGEGWFLRCSGYPECKGMMSLPLPNVREDES